MWIWCVLILGKWPTWCTNSFLCIHFYLIWYDIFVNCNWVVTRWQKYSTHLHTNNTWNDTKQTIHRTTQQIHVSSTSCSSSGETNCINTASGNSHSMLVAEMCAGWKKTPTCTHLRHQHRMTVTRGCIDTICLSWWWARCAQNMYYK